VVKVEAKAEAKAEAKERIMKKESFCRGSRF